MNIAGVEEGWTMSSSIKSGTNLAIDMYLQGADQVLFHLTSRLTGVTDILEHLISVLACYNPNVKISATEAAMATC